MNLLLKVIETTYSSEVTGANGFGKKKNEALKRSFGSHQSFPRPTLHTRIGRHSFAFLERSELDEKS